MQIVNGFTHFGNNEVFTSFWASKIVDINDLNWPILDTWKLDSSFGFGINNCLAIIIVSFGKSKLAKTSQICEGWPRY